MKATKTFVAHAPDLLLRAASALALFFLASVALAAERTFDSPEAGIAALFNAVEANDETALRAILGEHGEKLINSGDAVADAQGRAHFVAAYSDAHRIERSGDAQATLLVGEDEWPLPIPLVKAGDRWHFDTQKGEQEILNRRIGRNELAAIQVCLAIVDAQRDYVARQDSDTVLHYAPKFVSTPGKRDGLYWEAAPNEPASPLGPLLAAAAKEGYAAEKALSPYHGYFYRIITKQGEDAPGGAYDYMAKGKMIGGFAVVAYPAAYGASGVMTFIANHNGVVYQKDLGKDTAQIAAAMTTFNPDSSWHQP